MNEKERRAARRYRIMEMYRDNYSRPFWTAYKDGTGNLDKLATRSADFRYGVFMADPYAQWSTRFGSIDRKVMQELGVEVL